jgi:hypothetical protein
MGDTVTRVSRQSVAQTSPALVTRVSRQSVAQTSPALVTRVSRQMVISMPSAGGQAFYGTHVGFISVFGGGTK